VNDGRHIDADLGLLLGEGSHQRVREEPGVVAVYRETPSMPEDGWTDPTYYDVPVLKETVWSYDIPLYYYTGGVAGASMVLGMTALLLHADRLPDLG
jgi:hypothetical protein